MIKENKERKKTEPKENTPQEFYPFFSVATWSFGSEEGSSFSSRETITTTPTYSMGTEIK